MSNSIPSPCISVCLLDKNDVCVGCWRTADEITEWNECDDDRKLEILSCCRQRFQADQKHTLK